MGLFLSAEDLEELTGYKVSGKQIQQLIKQGINHNIRADGKPVVAIYAINPIKPDSLSESPRLDFLKKTV